MRPDVAHHTERTVRLRFQPPAGSIESSLVSRPPPIMAAARPTNSLEAVFLTDALMEGCGPEQAEILLGEMVERGGSVSEPVVVTPEVAELAANQAERTFFKPNGIFSIAGGSWPAGDWVP